MIKFDAVNHKYTLNGKDLISVTQLLKKHNLSDDFSFVDAEVLQKAADKGTMIHQEIEDYVLSGVIGFTEELGQYIKFTNEHNLKATDAEVRVHNDWLAGTIDQIGDDFILDIKTGSSVTLDVVRWQLSLYNRLLGPNKKARLLLCHLGEKPKLTELEPISDIEIDKLFEAERKGELYFKPTLKIGNNILEALEEVKNHMQELEAKKAELETEERKLKGHIAKLMREQDIKSFENELVKISYVAPYQRVTVDSKALKSDLPDVYEKYTKSTNIRESVRITWR